MSLKLLRQIFKACADDTRLRILNILADKPLTVNDISRGLNVSQSGISKHLSRLRLLRMVIDKRVGNSVYYSLNTASDTFQSKVISFVVSRFFDVAVFQKDKKVLRKLRRK